MILNLYYKTSYNVKNNASLNKPYFLLFTSLLSRHRFIPICIPLRLALVLFLENGYVFHLELLIPH